MWYILERLLLHIFAFSEKLNIVWLYSQCHQEEVLVNVLLETDAVDGIAMEDISDLPSLSNCNLKFGLIKLLVL